MNAVRDDRRQAKRDARQIQIFYEANEQSLFITFADGHLYWCQPVGTVEVLDDGSRRRRTLNGWKKTSVSGENLAIDRLSGRLVKVSMFQGTICTVQDHEYLLRRINDQFSPEVVAAQIAEDALRAAILDLIRLLTWQDFEILVDLVLSNSGWRRVSRVGGPQKTVDFELVLPVTGERAFVQVKSAVSAKVLQDYEQRLENTHYSRMFFVWHTGYLPERSGSDNVILIGPETLSRMVIDAGLSTWVRDKVA